MKIKTSADTSRPSRALLALLARRRGHRLGITLIVFVAVFALGFVSRGTAGYEEGVRRLRILSEDPLRIFGRLGSGMFASPRQLIISIKFEDFQKLKEQRNRAVEKGILSVTDKDYVSATVECDGKTINANIRLKGDLTDHLTQGDKWSFRVKAKGEHTLLGMKQFSLQHPDTRNYVYEWLFHRALLREDILGLRYEFVKVILNGRDLGVYALEEHFEKRLVEHNRRREGPIIRFNEDRLWAEWVQQKIPFQGARQNGSGSYMASEIDVFQTRRWTADPDARQVYDRAMALLEGFREGRSTTSEVFDIGRLAMFFAITDLMGAEHGARWHNTRFYFNPITAHLEPIGFDGDSGKAVKSLCFHMKDRHWSYNAWSSDPAYFKSLFSDPAFVEKYLACLARVSQRGYLDSLLAEVEEPLKNNLRIIHSEFPTFDFSKDVLYRNQDYIRSVLEPQSALAVYLAGRSGDHIELRVGNLQPLPVEILGMSCQGVDIPLTSPAATLPGRSPEEVVQYFQLEGALPPALAVVDSLLPMLRFQYHIPGVGESRECWVTPWPYPEAVDPNNDVVRKSPNVSDFDFIHVDERLHTISFQPGSWTIEKDLIIPNGYIVKCGPGTRLDISASSLILSFSPLEFLGTEDAPIIVTSTDHTGQGLVVMRAGDESLLQNVLFEDLMSPRRADWLTGSVTFYESPVSVEDCSFVRLRAEDNINVIRSRFRILDCYFVGSESDAFDSDFAVGEIRRTEFRDCGNDAIDVSGTSAEVSEIRVFGAGDKGLSAGEDSQVRVDGLWIDGANFGIGVKDLSFVEATNVHISRTAVGCAEYQKKPEYGPSSASINGLYMSSVVKPFVIERKCSLEVDGARIQPNTSHVWQQLQKLETQGKSADNLVMVR